MFNNFHYAYLVADLGFFLIWLVLFLKRKDLRKEILSMSLVIAPFGFTQYFYIRDYWHPIYSFGTIFGITGIEDIIWCFFIGGITAVIYEEIFGIKYSKKHLENHPIFMISFAILAVGLLFVGNIILRFNSMYVSVAIMLFFGICVLLFRHDLLKHAFLSGLITGAIMFFFYALFFNVMFNHIIENWWYLKNVSGILIFGVPIEELMFGFSWGFVGGPAYEFITGLKLQKE